MNDRRRIVRVSANSERAFEEPAFLIRSGGKLFLTVAVLEYDPEHKDITAEQKRAIAEMETLFDKDGCDKAVPVKAMAFRGANTGPGGEEED